MSGKQQGYQPLQNQQPPPAYGGAPQGPYYGQPTAAPPPYPQHQGTAHHNVVVVQQQPVVTGVTYNNRYASDNYLTLSIVMTVMCFVFGCWPALMCTIPAIVFSTAARDAQARGDVDDARRKRSISLILNVFGSIFWTMVYIGAIIGLAVSLTSADSCYYDYYDSYYYCY